LQATLDVVAQKSTKMEATVLLSHPEGSRGRCRTSEGDGHSAHLHAAGAVASVKTAGSDARRGLRRTLTPDEMVADIATKIERMGAVNMMAIDQFDGPRWCATTF